MYLGHNNKKIKTYGRKRNERVIPINLWDTAVDNNASATNSRGTDIENNEMVTKSVDDSVIARPPSYSPTTRFTTIFAKRGYISPKIKKVSQPVAPMKSLLTQERSDEKGESNVSDLIKRLTIDDVSAPETHLNPLSFGSLESLLKFCGQNNPQKFTEFITIESLILAKKIGEATFSEVFSLPGNLVMKIIPFGQSSYVLVNGEPQCSVEDVLQEVKVTSEMQNCHDSGYIRLYRTNICKGTYPQQLIDEWDRWDKSHESENDRPDYFSETQLYCVLILEHGGLDLEHTKIKNWKQAWSVFWQTACLIAQGEIYCSFEHRDLHHGNVLCRTIPVTQCITFDLPSLSKIIVVSHGIKATIIDYTLSRMTWDTEVVFKALDDESYFTGEGDYQFDIYRMMRKETRGNWAGFYPKTNILWLHYLSDKLLNSKNIRKPPVKTKQRRAKPSGDSSPIETEHSCFEELRKIYECALRYGSAKELVERFRIIRQEIQSCATDKKPQTLL